MRVARNRWTLVGLVLVTLLVLAALAAPWLAPANPITGDLSAALRSPSTANLLSTDAQGRDVLSRVLFGARLSLAVGFASQVIALAAGRALGLVAGFYGRWVDALVMRVADVTLAFPSLLLLIAVAAAVRPSLPVVCLAMNGPTAVPMPRAVNNTPMPVAAFPAIGKILSPKTASKVIIPPPIPQAGFTSR